MSATPHLLLCGPHEELPSPEELRELHRVLTSHTRIYEVVVSTIKQLPNLYKQLESFDTSLAHVPGAESCFVLADWLLPKVPVKLNADLTNVTSMPLIVLLQLALYLKHVDRFEPASNYGKVLHSVERHGVQGFCSGFLTASAIAFSEHEEQLANNIAISLRLAMCIGAYVDRDSTYAEPPNPASVISVRWRDGESSLLQVANLLQRYPSAYISCITDSSCVTVTADTEIEPQLVKGLQESRLRVKPTSVKGRFHSIHHHSVAAHTLRSFTRSRDNLQYPLSSKLRVPLRSNTTGKLISVGDSVTDIAIQSILLQPSEWYLTVRESIADSSHNPPTIVSLAFEEGVLPLSLSNRKSLLYSNDGINSADISANAIRGNGEIQLDTTKINNNTEFPPGSVAVVGMACRLAGTNDVDQFWELLESGASKAREVPADRFNIDGQRIEGQSGTKFWGNFIENPESFDFRLFKKSSRETVSWDPAKRILLEVVYEALESTGFFGPLGQQAPKDYGCYIGVVANDYYNNVSCHPPNAYSMLGTSRAFFSGQISHQFGFTGPAMSIDTACSSSLVAVHMACQAIQAGDCSRAVAGGTNIFTSPYDYQNLAAAGFLSPSGGCKPFDVAADGYCRGEGVGAIILKSYSKAMEEGDNILGVIVGSAVNQSYNDTHITVPCASSQTAVFEKALSIAKVRPSSITYIEAHGTGTQVGDPIEIQSIRDAFGGSHRKSKLHIGSVKGNIGHTEATAGVTGLIKTLLMLQHNRIPGQVGYQSLNPKIPALELDMMEIPKDCQPWKADSRIACVNSYGAAGSNAVVVVRDAGIHASGPDSASPNFAFDQPLFLSAATEQSLIKYSIELLKHIEVQQQSTGNPVNILSDTLFNLAIRGNHDLPYKVTKSVKDLEGLKDTLGNIVAGSEKPIKDLGSNISPVVMVFAGQENDFVGLSEEIVESSKLLRHHLDTCNSEMAVLGVESLFPTIYKRESLRSLPALHTALFASQYAIAMTWIESGLSVSSVVGHSFGQLTALCISGSLSLHDSLKLVIKRAELIESSWGEDKGSLVSVQSELSGLEASLEVLNSENPEHPLEIACFNHPTNHVVVGDSEAINTFESYVNDEDALHPSLRTKRLNVKYGFHSKLSEPILPGLQQIAHNITWKKPIIPIALATKEQVDMEPGPWLIPEHTRKPVYFSRVIDRLAEKYQPCIWLEAGQGSSVMSLIKNCLKDKGKQMYCPSALNTTKAVSTVTNTVVELWKAGTRVQFWHYHRIQRRDFNFKGLPPYQFEKTKLWLDFIDRVTLQQNSDSISLDPPEPTHEFLSFLGHDSSGAASFAIDPESERYMYLLNGHLIFGDAIAPVSLYIELLSRACITVSEDASYDTHVLSIESMQMIGHPIGLDTQKNFYIKLMRCTDGINFWDFEFSSKPKFGDEVQIHTIGRVGLDKRNDPLLAENTKRWSALIGYKRCLSILNSEEAEKMQGRHIYRALERLASYDEMYRGIKSISCEGHEAAGKVVGIQCTNSASSRDPYDAPTIDGMMQFAGVLVNYFVHSIGEEARLCRGINRIVTGSAFDITVNEWTAYAILTEDTDERTVCDVYIFDKESQQIVIAFLGFLFTRMPVSLVQRSIRSANPNAFRSKVSQVTENADIRPRSHSLVQENANLEAGDHSIISSTQAAITDADTSASNRTEGKTSQKAQVYEVISHVTDIPLDELSDELSLESLGIDSLLVTEVIREILSVFGVDIDLNTFLFFANLKAVCEHIDSTLGCPSDVLPSLPSSLSDSTCENAVSTPFSSVTSQQEYHSSSLLHAQTTFAACKGEYLKAATETKAIGFWENCYPHQAALVLAYVREAFSELGCDISTIKPNDIVPRVSHLPRHKQLVRQLYRVLEDANLIKEIAGQYIRTSTAVDTTLASSLFLTIVHDFPLHASVHKIVQAVGSELAPCLKGTKDGLQIVFGNKKNKETLDDLYENWPLVRAGTVALGAFLGKALSKAPLNQTGKFRLLEVGAGTGGTTKYLVRHLQRLDIPFEYIFTDLSSSLVAAAKRTFRDCPEMKFKTLDVEQDPPSEWQGAFHVVLSTNCVHATRDLTVSLASIRQMLRPDGVCALVEITRNMFWLDIAVGLFEGWWAFKDGRTHAVADEQRWKESFLRAGYAAVDWTDGTAPEAQTIRVIAGFASDASR